MLVRGPRQERRGRMMVERGTLACGALRRGAGAGCVARTSGAARVARAYPRARRSSLPSAPARRALSGSCSRPRVWPLNDPTMGTSRSRRSWSRQGSGGGEQTRGGRADSAVGQARTKKEYERGGIHVHRAHSGDSPQGVEYHRTEVLAKDTAPFGTDCGSAVTWHYLIRTHQVVSSGALVRT